MIAQRASAALLRVGFAVAAIGLASLLPANSRAQSVEPSGTVALSSQLVDRGLAITPDTAVLQGMATLNWASGWSLGLSGSSELREPGRLIETAAQASRYWSLSGDWQMQANVLYYDYPNRTKVYDRAEAGVYWTYRDILTFGASTFYLVHSRDHQPRGAADVDFHWPLRWHLSLSAGAGIAQPPVSTGNHYGYGYAHLATYRYGHAGLLWNDRSWRLELDRIATDPAVHRSDGLRTAPWVGTISFSF